MAIGPALIIIIIFIRVERYNNEQDNEANRRTQIQILENAARAQSKV